jgi:hypothetical protein
MALRRETQLPVGWCLDAVRAHDGHEARIAYLRRRFVEHMRLTQPGSSYAMPPGLRPYC